MNVALVVPVLNEAALLHELLPRLSRLAQDAELVVVDGGSTDGSYEAVSTHAATSGYRVLRSPRGRAQQMNAGARATKAPTLLFLHADTDLPDDAIASVERAATGSFVGGSFKLRLMTQDPRLKLAQAIINLRSRLMPSATGDQAIFVCRDAFERIGGFLEIALCEDLDLISRLRTLGRLALIDGYAETSARRWQEGGVNRTIVLMWLLRVGCHVGIDPQTLKRWYTDARRSGSNAMSRA